MDCKFGRLGGIDRYPHGAVPGIARFLDNLHHAIRRERDLCGAGGKKVDVQRVALMRVHITRDRSDKASDVARTTSHAKPGAALVVADGRERVWIEEEFAIERDAGDKP